MRKKPLLVALVLLVVGAITYIFLGDSIMSSRSGADRDRIAAPKKGELLVGVLTPATGYLSPWGEQAALGARVGKALLDQKGGIGSAPVRVEIVDTASDPDTAAALAKKLVKSGAKLLIDAGDAVQTNEVRLVAEKAGVPLIYIHDGPYRACSPAKVVPSGAPSQGADPDARREHATQGATVSSVTWGFALSWDMAVEPFLIFLSDKLADPSRQFSVYYLTEGEPDSQDFTKFVRGKAESLNFKTVEDSSFDTRVKDFYIPIRDVVSVDPDLWIVNYSGDLAELLMAQAAKLQVTKEVSVAAFQSFDIEATRNMIGSLEGMYTVSRYVDSIDNPANKQFLQLFGKLGLKEKPGAIAAAAYGALQIAAEAFTRGKGTDLSAFNRGMDKLDTVVPQGRVYTDSTNHTLVLPLYALKIEKGQYVLAESLGDVEHPGTEHCWTERVPEERPPEKRIL